VLCWQLKFDVMPGSETKMTNLNRARLRQLGRVLLNSAVLVIALLAIAAPSDAALLGLSGGNPDISSATIKVSYDYNNQVFTATGVTQTLKGGAYGTPGAGLGMIDASFQITVHIDHSGNILTNAGANTLTVKGASSALFGDSNVRTLLSGNLATGGPLASFGFLQYGPNNSKTRFQFRFTNDETGAVAGNFTPMLGVNLDASAMNFTGSFSTVAGFDNYTSGRMGYLSSSADTTPEVPEPASLAMWSLLGLGLAALRTRTVLRSVKAAR
jgi:hypothetical protein